MTNVDLSISCSASGLAFCAGMYVLYGTICRFHCCAYLLVGSPFNVVSGSPFNGVLLSVSVYEEKTLKGKISNALADHEG